MNVGMTIRRVDHASRSRVQGFSLLEVAVALGVLAVVMAGLAPFFVHVSRSTSLAASDAAAHVLAVSKVHELRAAFAAAPDTPPASPAGTLEADVPGWVEWLDAEGRVAGAAALPGDFVRRWAATPIGGSPDAHVIVVLVFPASAIGRSASRPRQPGEGWAAAVTRRTP